MHVYVTLCLPTRPPKRALVHRTLGCRRYFRFWTTPLTFSRESADGSVGASGFCTSAPLRTSSTLALVGEANATSGATPLALAILLCNFCRALSAPVPVHRLAAGKRVSTYPSMTKFHPQCVPVGHRQGQIDRPISRSSFPAKCTYKSDSVMSRIVSHVSKPWSRKTSRYCEMPSSPNTSCNFGDMQKADYRLGIEVLGTIKAS